MDNVKRTWVNYGGAREWSDPTQGQVGGYGYSKTFESSIGQDGPFKKHPPHTHTHMPHRVRSFSTMLLR